MPYIDPAPHGGSADLLYTGMFDEAAGTVARTIPRGLVGAATLAALNTTGQVAARAIPLPAGLVVSNIAVFSGNTAATGPTHFWVGLTDANLNVLAVSADQGAAAIAASTLFKLPVTVPVTIGFTGLYYVVCSASASTTAPTLSGATLAAGIGNGSGNPVLCGSAGTQVIPPAIGSQLNGGNVSGNGSMNFAAWIS